MNYIKYTHAKAKNKKKISQASLWGPEWKQADQLESNRRYLVRNDDVDHSYSSREGKKSSNLRKP